MDVLITPITIAPHSKEYLIIDVTYISGQQGELGIGWYVFASAPVFSTTQCIA